MANILVVDDEAEIVDLIDVYLKHEHHITKCYTPKQALEADLSTIELAILDVMMPGMDGFTLCRKIREADHNFPIIMLTAKDTDNDKINGLALGADDYMTKPFNPMELAARIKAQLRRARVFSALEGENETEPDEIEVSGLTINPKAHTCSLYGKPVSLTPIEFSILLLLCQNPGRVISSEEIFEKVWGERYLDSNNTVMVHVQKLRKKLGDTNKQKKFIHTVWGVGYKIEN